MKWILSCWLLVCCPAVFAATPLVDLSRSDIGQHGARVPPNLLLNLSLTHAAAGAAHPGGYVPARDYAGYFDARMCYRYPYRSVDGASVPDLRAGTGYFSASKAADAQRGCGGDSFNGNFLNWASTSLLDIVRFALTGGDRVIDDVRKTVLQRAYLPDGSNGIDLYAHPEYFPRKLLLDGVQAATPFAVSRLAIVSCRDRLLFGDGALPLEGSCDAPGKAGALGVLLARVQVCDEDEGARRPELCMAYGNNYKPVGALQQHGGRVRVGVHGQTLRAPLAHPGAQRWAAPDFLPQDNPDAEWHAETGVYAARDGVIAAINRLGRDSEAPGSYAAAAPQAELLYASLRYLQGRQPGAASASLTAPWRDPQLASCQRQVVVTLGDAGASPDRHVPGNTVERARAADSFITPPFDVMAWTRAVGVLESDGAQGNPRPLPALAALDHRGYGPYGGSFYAAGLAYWSHLQPVRPGGGRVMHHAGDLMAAVPQPGVITPLRLAAKYGGFLDENGDGNPFGSASGNPYAEWSRDQDLPDHYFPGGDPQALIAGLRAAFVQAERATLAPVLAGPSLLALARNGEDAYWFESQLQLGDGAMRLSRHAFRIGTDGSVIAGKALWQVDGAAGKRPVYTLDAQGALISLDWSGKNALAAAPHGNLVHVGVPGLGLPGADYLQHRQRLQQRRAMLYLGTGDGLLHGVDAASGSELFAYLPRALREQAAPASGALHGGAAASAEVRLAGRWKTVLASGMGGGAQGVFALDVTDPMRFAQDGARWEFTDRDDAIMGNLRAPPAFARLNMGGKDGARVYRDMLVAGSGYNNSRDDGKDSTAPASSAAIFLLALDKPAGAPWQLDSNYYRLKIPVSSEEGAVEAQALAPPALVAGSDGALAYIYAGDLQGNLWRLDMATGPPWKEGVGRKRVFVARDAQGRRQPITQQLKVAYAPGGGYLLLFGTGKLVEPGDAWPAAFLSQSFYAVHDDLNEQTPTRSRDDLQARSVDAVAGKNELAIGGADLHYTGSGAAHGWYLDFVGAATTGERSVHSGVLAAGKVAFNTVLPGRDPCAQPATRLYVLDVLSGFAADAAGLMQAGETSGSLLAGLARAPPQLLEVDSKVGVAGASGRAEGRKQLAVLQPGMPGKAAAKVASGPLPARRLGWREVANWRELHEAARK